MKAKKDFKENYSKKNDKADIHSKRTYFLHWDLFFPSPFACMPFNIKTYSPENPIPLPEPISDEILVLPPVTKQEPPNHLHLPRRRHHQLLK